jgi:hypothetical protein
MVTAETRAWKNGSSRENLTRDQTHGLEATEENSFPAEKAWRQPTDETGTKAKQKIKSRVDQR